MEEANENQILVAEYVNLENAKQALVVLKNQGFTLDHLSIVSRSDDSTLDKLRDESLIKEQSAETASKGAAVGAAIGGLFGAPMAVATLIGPFFLLGPIVTMGAGAALGGLLGAASHWGVPREKIEEYERHVEEGRALVIVQPGQRVPDTKAAILTTEPISLERFDFKNSTT